MTVKSLRSIHFPEALHWTMHENEPLRQDIVVGGAEREPVGMTGDSCVMLQRRS